LVLPGTGQATLAAPPIPGPCCGVAGSAENGPSPRRIVAVAGGAARLQERRKDMTTTSNTAARDRKVILSTLWIFAILNYAYADIMTLFFNPVLQPEEQQRILSGYVGDIRITQGFVLAGAILMETAIVMVLLSRVLPHSANRWANILAGLLHTAAVIWSMTGGAVNVFYVFFATIEVACTLFIVWYAWTWRKPALSATPATKLRQPTPASS
jgi:MFS family permease